MIKILIHRDRYSLEFFIKAVLLCDIIPFLIDSFDDCFCDFFIRFAHAFVDIILPDIRTLSIFDRVKE